MKTIQTPPRTIDEYIGDFPRPAQTVLRKVRSAIRKGIPGAEEAISYRIPAYRVNGRMALYFAGWKAHYSLYPSTARMIAAFKDDLAPYEVNHKGTIRFPLDEPVPVKLIEALARFRAKETVQGVGAKPSASKKP